MAHCIGGGIASGDGKNTSSVPLRPTVCTLWRTDYDNNVGIGAPEIEYGFEPGGDWIDLTTVHKVGFGTGTDAVSK